MEKINIAELLKDCPKGMELDCTMYEDVYFDYVDELNIIHCYIKNEGFKTSITFNQHGTPNSNIKSKCVIFPKGKTTWEGFHRPFMDGDVVFAISEYSDTSFEYVAIFKQIRNNDLFVHCFYSYRDDIFGIQEYLCDDAIIRLATEEEKQKLFQAIKDNGYRWNTETKTLERLFVPKFKVWNMIKSKDSEPIINTITKVCENYYELDDGCTLPLNCQDNWEIVPGKFDISTLIPFESRVLIRDNKLQKWYPAIWGVYDPETYFPYKLIGCISLCCIPYEGNEHLINTTNDCDEFYKTWE